jgi:anthranilate synthase component 2
MILLIDNYDSFSYNLYQLAGSLEPDIRVIRNDEKTVEEIRDMHPGAIILSPGPGKPCDAGVTEEVIRKMAGECPILGVCLGHQAICEALGGQIVHAKELVHGKAFPIRVDQNSKLFHGLPPVIQAARYHSLAASRESLPPVLRITAETEDGEIMAVEHKTLPLFGVQFHPESIMTEKGDVILRNFLSLQER